MYAAKRRDLTILDRRERSVYKAAMPIVEKALRQPTLLRRELFIHDAIIKMADYDYEYLKISKSDPDLRAPARTAYGVLINKKAVCMGFSDAFYLLGNLAGLNVGYWNGMAGGEPKGPHAWNTITIAGITYFVDTTFDHRGYVTKNLKRHDYVYFNAPWEIISSTHSWNRNYEAGLRIAEKADANFFYTASEYNAAEELFGYYYSSVQQGFQAIAKHILMGNRRVAGFMMTYDPKYEKSSVYFPEIERHMGMIVQNSAYRKRPLYKRNIPIFRY